MGKRRTETLRKPTGRALIQALCKRVEKYDLINNLAQAPADISFSQIARSDIDFAKADPQKILPARLNRATVNFADKDQVHGLSMSRHLLVRVWVYSDSTLGLFYSGAIPNVMSWKMVGRLHVRMMPTTRLIKVANCAFEKCVGHLRDVPIRMGELVVPLKFLVMVSSLYDAIIWLPRMIELRARPDYYRMVLKLHFEGYS